MASLNLCQFIGNIGKDPAIRSTNSGGQVVSFSLACNERRKDASGEWVDHVEWVNIVTFAKTADFCAKFLHKGSSVYCEGRLQTRKWQDKDGQDRYTTEIVANRVQCLDKREAGQGGGQSQEPAQTPAGNVREAFEMDSSVPF